MALNYRVQVKLPHTSALPRDTVTNTFYFGGVFGVEATEITEIHNRLIAAYAAIDQDLSPVLSRAANACTATYYDMADLEPRIPIETRTFTLANSVNAAALPSEVALVLSYNSVLTSGVNLARRRGRVYLGPWSAANATVRPSVGLISLLQNFSVALETQINVLVPINWQQYSPTDNVIRQVVNSWVDNEWDTQRRRGTAATTRTTNVVTPNF